MSALIHGCYTTLIWLIVIMVIMVGSIAIYFVLFSVSIFFEREGKHLQDFIVCLGTGKDSKLPLKLLKF